MGGVRLAKLESPEWRLGFGSLELGPGSMVLGPWRRTVPALSHCTTGIGGFCPVPPSVSPRVPRAVPHGWKGWLLGLAATPGRGVGARISRRDASHNPRLDWHGPKGKAHRNVAHAVPNHQQKPSRETCEPGRPPSARFCTPQIPSTPADGYLDNSPHSEYCYKVSRSARPGRPG